MAAEVSDYSRFIHQSRYARWVEDEGRRETWEETVDRYCTFFKDRFPSLYPKEELKEAITSQKIVPSMRALMTAGPALDRDEIAAYNCSYLAIDHPAAFSEVMYILMCGTGVGFSVERDYVKQLPVVAEEFHHTDSVIQVADSRIGWASAYRELISLLYSGRLPKWDMSRIRPAGAKLKTFGGRASGPKPLDDLFHFTVSTFKGAAGRRLTSLECHDLVCKIADIVIVGGVRRSALISLSNLTDERLRGAKNGAWWEENGQRALANNSAAYTEIPDVSIFLKEWHSLYESRSGERGLFNRVAATRNAIRSGRRSVELHGKPVEFGTNPCAEIVLRSQGLCNLSECVIRPEDTLETLKENVRLATIIGTFQSTLTNFRFLRKGWKINAEEERLLGVSLTGILDHPVLSKVSDEAKQWLQEMKQVAIDTNKEWADKLGIPQSAAITTVKPSGTVSQLVGCSSGIHPAYSNYYVRTVRMDNKDPLTQFLKSQGIPNEPDVTKPNDITVFSFPMRAASTSRLRKDVSAMEQLELYLQYLENWCEHNVSITVYYKDSEFLEIGGWVYKNFDKVSGISFLPYSDHVYAQAPYQEIDEPTYNKLVAEMPKINWEQLVETEDRTTGQHELACTGNSCEIVGVA